MEEQNNGRNYTEKYLTYTFPSILKILIHSIFSCVAQFFFFSP